VNPWRGLDIALSFSWVPDGISAYRVDAEYGRIVEVFRAA
jgi:hypothetical protein